METSAKQSVIERDINFIETHLPTLKYRMIGHEYNETVCRLIEMARLAIEEIKPDESLWDYVDKSRDVPANIQCYGDDCYSEQNSPNPPSPGF